MGKWFKRCLLLAVAQISFEASGVASAHQICQSSLSTPVFWQRIEHEIKDLGVLDLETRLEMLVESKRVTRSCLRDLRKRILGDGADGYYAELGFLELLVRTHQKLRVEQTRSAPGKRFVADFLIRDPEARTPIVVEVKSIHLPGTYQKMQRKIRHLINEAIRQMDSTQGHGRNWIVIRVNGLSADTAQQATEELSAVTKAALRPHVELTEPELEGVVLITDDGQSQRVVWSQRWTGTRWTENFLGVDLNPPTDEIQIVW